MAIEETAKPTDKRFLEITPNPLEVQLRRLMREAEGKARIYHQLFEVNIQPILNFAYFVTWSTQETTDKTEADGVLKRFEENYTTIRVSGYEGVKEPPFIAIGMLIPELKRTLDEVFRTRTKDSYQNLEEVAFAIKVLGNLYYKQAVELTARIRGFKGMEGYKLQIQDPISGHTETIA